MSSYIPSSSLQIHARTMDPFCHHSVLSIWDPLIQAHTCIIFHDFGAHSRAKGLVKMVQKIKWKNEKREAILSNNLSSVGWSCHITLWHSAVQIMMYSLVFTPWHMGCILCYCWKFACENDKPCIILCICVLTCPVPMALLQVFHKRMPPEAIDLTSRLLQYSPNLRCTAVSLFCCFLRVRIWGNNIQLELYYLVPGYLPTCSPNIIIHPYNMMFLFVAWSMCTSFLWWASRA